MKILYIPTLERPRVLDIDSSLESLQSLVGGWIGCTYPWPEESLGLVFNDNGIAEGLPPNRYLWETRNIIFGNFFLCGLGEDDFTDLPEQLIARFSRRFAAPEVILLEKSGFTVTSFYDREDLFL